MFECWSSSTFLQSPIFCPVFGTFQGWGIPVCLLFYLMCFLFIFFSICLLFSIYTSLEFIIHILHCLSNFLSCLRCVRIHSEICIFCDFLEHPCSPLKHFRIEYSLLEAIASGLVVLQSRAAQFLIYLYLYMESWRSGVRWHIGCIYFLKAYSFVYLFEITLNFALFSRDQAVAQLRCCFAVPERQLGFKTPPLYHCN